MSTTELQTFYDAVGDRLLIEPPVVRPGDGADDVADE